MNLLTILNPACVPVLVADVKQHMKRALFFALPAIAIILSGCSNSDAALQYFSKGKDHYVKKELEKAAEQFTRAADLDDRLLNARVMLAKVHYYSGKPADALASLERVLAGSPDHTGALYWSARTLTAGKDAKKPVTGADEEKAMGFLARALEVDGGHIGARTLLGLLYEKRSMYREALREYHAALREEDSLVSARANLAALYHRLGLKDRAVAEITKAVKIAELTGIDTANLKTIQKEIEGQ